MYCNIEDGWECDGGTATTPDTCTEICGDDVDYQTSKTPITNMVHYNAKVMGNLLAKPRLKLSSCRRH